MKPYDINGGAFYKTRRGFLVKMLSTKANSEFSHVGLIIYPGGQERVGQWNSFGKFESTLSARSKFKPHALDLI